MSCRRLRPSLSMGRLGARLHRTADASAHHGRDATLPAGPAGRWTVGAVRFRRRLLMHQPHGLEPVHSRHENIGEQQVEIALVDRAIPLRPSLAATRLWPARSSSIVSCTALSSSTIRIFANWLHQDLKRSQRKVAEFLKILPVQPDPCRRFRAGLWRTLTAAEPAVRRVLGAGWAWLVHLRKP